MIIIVPPVVELLSYVH